MKLPNKNLALTLIIISVITLSYVKYSERTRGYTIPNEVSNGITQSERTEIDAVRQDIGALYDDIVEARRTTGTDVSVSALVLNDNLSDLKRVRTELKVELDILNAKVYKLNEISSCNVSGILGGVFEGTECQIINSVSSETIGRSVISAMVSESGGGRKLCGTYNALGIMKNGKCENFSSVENFIEVGIKKRVGGYFNRLEKCGITRECTEKIFVGKGKYCQSACENWSNNFLDTYYSKIWN